jgi:hypothetical protein
MDEKPGRRWFAFRLRTLFVGVAVFSIPFAWLFYSRQWLRERHRHLVSGDVWVDEFNKSAPGFLSHFGEPGIVRATYFGPPEGLEVVQRAFPETQFNDPETIPFVGPIICEFTIPSELRPPVASQNEAEIKRPRVSWAKWNNLSRTEREWNGSKLGWLWRLIRE